MNEHDAQQNPASCSRCTNIATNKLQDDSDPALGIEVAACHPQPEDNMLTARSMRHVKERRLADCMMINLKSLTLIEAPTLSMAPAMQ
jgi:hypothetical protein